MDLLESDALTIEMSNAQFADPRLSRRLGSVTRRLVAAPSLSFPQAFPKGAELEGAYRFFANPLVNPEAILSGHVDATRQRCLAQGSVLVVHDTTTLRFAPGGERRGLGRLKRSSQAFFAHFSLALSDDGTRRPLGVVGFKPWVRTDEANGGEQRRWATQVEVAQQALHGVERVIHVMDREADDYRLFAELIEGGHRFIIRSSYNRFLAASSGGEPRRLDDAVARIECAVERDAPLSKRVDAGRSKVSKRIHPSRDARVTTLAIGKARVSLRRPQTQGAHLPPSVELNVVRVWEPNPPPGESAIEWVLLTTEPVDEIDDLVRVVDRYRARWTIEEYFKAVKTGCAYEARQLEDYEGLVNALAVFAPIACRLLILRAEARRAPDAPAHLVIDDESLEVLRATGHRALSPSPTTREVLLAVAALGGHIRWSGEPGWLTLARGFAELQTLTRGWRAAKFRSQCDQR
jgi:hypothetical protein